jgi:pilus assembly protein CpaF
MFSVVITEKGGAQRRTEFDKTEVTIGRVQGNDIILPKGNVSKRHSRIVLKDNRFIVVDLKSTNGTYVNGRKITSPLVVKSGDKIYIGDFILTLEEQGGAAVSAPAPVAAAPMSGPPPMGPPPMGSPPMGPPPMGGPPPLGAPVHQTLGGPGPMGGPPPMGPGPMGGPPPMMGSPMMGSPAMGSPAMGSPAMGNPGMGHMGNDAPPMPQRPPSMRPPSLSPRPSPVASAPPPLPAPPRQEMADPPAMPPGADRFKLDEEPADADETMAPSPRMMAAARPRVEPPPAQRAEPPRAEPPRAEPPRAEPPRERISEPRIADGPRTDLPPARAPELRRSSEIRAESVEMPRVSGEMPRSVEHRAVEHRAVEHHVVEHRAVEPGPLGPFETLLEEVGVLEVVAEGPSRLMVDRGTGLVPAGKSFASEAALAAATARLFANAGARLVHGVAVQEAALPDGTHVLAVLPPFAVGGPFVEIRRLGRPTIPGETLVAQGMLSNDMLSTLRSAVAVRRNIIVIGPSDAGVAPLIAALTAMVHEDERIACIEASPELAIPSGRAIRFQSGDGDLSALIDRASTFRSDRLVIDGVTGGHVRSALTALVGRSGGSMVGIRTQSSGAVLEHLGALASMSGGRDGVAALVAAASHVVVRMGRSTDGVRRIESIAELQSEGLVALFEHDDGGFASTGTAASFS